MYYGLAFAYSRALPILFYCHFAFCLAVFFFFSCYGDPQHLHSFPTRRSSDLQYFGSNAKVLPDGGNRLAPYCWLQVCPLDRKSTRLNSSHQIISYAVFCLKKKNTT